MEGMDRIVAEVTNRKPPAIVDTPEQAVFRDRVTREIKAIRDRGGIVDLPPEFPNV